MALTLALVLVSAACSGSANEPDQLAYRVESESTGSARDDAEQTDANWNSLTDQVVVSDATAEAAFRTALDTLGQSYIFQSRLGSADDAPVEVIGGRVGQALTYRVIAGGAIVEVIDLGDAVWTRVGDGDWERTESSAGDDPLVALAQPMTLTAGATADSVLLTYNPADLGFGGTDPLEVEVEIGDDSIIFAATTADGLSLLSTLTAAPDLEPITAPG